MRIVLLRSLALLLLAISTSASAVTLDFVTVGNTGNACDTQSQGCFGSVNYTYDIGRYEVTNSQYAEFLNAKAAADPLGLFNTNMALTPGGITRAGVSGSFTYSVITGRGDIPVTNVSIFDAMRFANWIANGQGTGDTENGSYTLVGGTPTPSNGSSVARLPGATIVLPTEDEWYKAAYYDALSTNYFDYPAGSDIQSACSAPTATPNSANCGAAATNNLTIRGSYTGSASPYGTFDQGGNAFEWSETIVGLNRVARGGSYALVAGQMAASFRLNSSPSGEFANRGFRLGSVTPIVPEPSTGLLVLGGLLGLASRRKLRA